MPDLITTAFVKQFGSTIDMLSQQKGSRLMDKVRREDTVRGEEVFMDQFGQMAASRVTTRHADSPLDDTPHARRQLSMIDVETGTLVDDFDKLKMLVDPTSTYTQAMAWAIGREIDDIIIEKFFADAKTGKAGGTTTVFDSANLIAVNFAAGSNVGLTVEKLREARRLLLAGNVDPSETFHIAVTAKQMDDLLGTTEVTSSDFNSVKALVQGEINTFMGFNFVHTERLLTDVSSFRRVPVWAESGVGLAVALPPRVQMAPRPDKRFSTYIYYNTSVGSTRLEEAKVVEVLCNEA